MRSFGFHICACHVSGHALLDVLYKIHAGTEGVHLLHLLVGHASQGKCV